MVSNWGYFAVPIKTELRLPSDHICTLNKRNVCPCIQTYQWISVGCNSTVSWLYVAHCVRCTLFKEMECLVIQDAILKRDLDKIDFIYNTNIGFLHNVFRRQFSDGSEHNGKNTSLITHNLVPEHLFAFHFPLPFSFQLLPIRSKNISLYNILYIKM
jgi:hypothetical protein